MFRRINSAQTNVTIYIDDKPHTVNADESIATILVNAGILAVHNAPDGAPRGPYCMMGVCFDCMITLEDGRVEQACQIHAAQGMRIYLPATGNAGSDQ